MSVALCLLLYTVLLIWGAPWADRSRRVRPVSVTAWIAAIASSLTASAVAAVLLVVTVVNNALSGATIAICLHFVGITHQIDVPGQRWILDFIVTAALFFSGFVTYRFSRGMHTLHSRSIDHARDVRIVGNTHAEGVVIVDAAQPGAYCVAGRPSAIVVTTAALSTLTGPELAAVLSHERAHLRGRHHHIWSHCGR